MEYRLPTEYCNTEWMNRCRFHYSEKFSSREESIYQKRLPVWRQGDNITLEGRILVTLETGEVRVDVYDVGFRGKYAPYYLRPSYYNDILSKIDERIDEELNKCCITKEETEDDLH